MAKQSCIIACYLNSFDRDVFATRNHGACFCFFSFKFSKPYGEFQPSNFCTNTRCALRSHLVLIWRAVQNLNDQYKLIKLRIFGLEWMSKWCLRSHFVNFKGRISVKIMTFHLLIYLVEPYLVYVAGKISAFFSINCEFVCLTEW